MEETPRADHEPPPFGHLGPALRWLRLRRGLRQMDLAAAAGLSNSQLSEYEMTRTRPTIEVLERILLALDANIWDLADAFSMVGGASGPRHDTEPMDADPLDNPHVREALGGMPLTPEHKEELRGILRGWQGILSRRE